jgi:hypothetical protein
MLPRHRQTTPEASSSYPSPVIPFNRPTFSPGSGSSPTAPPDDLGPCLHKPQNLSQFLYKHPLLAPERLIHSHATGSLRTDSSWASPPPTLRVSPPQPFWLCCNSATLTPLTALRHLPQTGVRGLL